MKLSPFNLFSPNTVFELLSLPGQLLGNGMMTVANTANTVIDATAPIGLAGNELFGPAFETVHKIGDQVIAGVSDGLSGVGETLGSTNSYNNTHYQNEWLDHEFKPTLNPVEIISQTVGNALVATTNVANDILDAVDPIGELGNDAFGSLFVQAHEAGDNVIDGITDVVRDIGADVGATLAPTATHYENEDFSADSSTVADTTSTVGEAYEAQGQNSFKLSDATVEKVRNYYQQFDQVENQQQAGLWRPIYQTIRDEVATFDSVDQGTLNWFKVALAVASGDKQSLLYQFVRLGTGKSLAGQDIHFTDGEFYQASNVLIKTLAGNLLNGINDEFGNVVVPAGYIPSAGGDYGLVKMDATQALENLGGSLADWTGITPWSILDHYLGVDTSALNGGDNPRDAVWYFELLGEVVVELLESGVSVPSLIQQFTAEITIFAGLFIEGELLQSNFSSQDQLMNTLTQLIYAYAGDLAGTAAVATNIFSSDTDIILGNLFSNTLKGGDGRDVIKAGWGNDKVYGGQGDDLIFGEWGNDTLNGGEGLDILVGGRGDDMYIIDDGRDFTLEKANQGVDTVLSSANHQLARYVENLYLQGDADLKATGNTEDNHIKGNVGNNQLFGLSGDDVLEAVAGDFNLLNGGTGDDILKGSAGSDIYQFEKGFGVDIIMETELQLGAADIIEFGAGIEAADLLLAKQSDNLIIGLEDSTDRIAVTDFYKGENHQVEFVKFANGDRLNLGTMDIEYQYYV